MIEKSPLIYNPNVCLQKVRSIVPCKYCYSLSCYREIKQYKKRIDCFAVLRIQCLFDRRSGSGMNIPDHISESLETRFWGKILKFFDTDANPVIFLSLDPGSGMEKIRIQDIHHPCIRSVCPKGSGKEETLVKDALVSGSVADPDPEPDP
jgi:hypothetical protein